MPGITNLKSRRMLIADKYVAACREPKSNDKKEVIILVGNSTCVIKKPTKQNEIDEIKARFKSLVDEIKILSQESISWSELIVMNCSSCELTKIHEKHGGGGRTIPFRIDRTSKPAICMQMIRAESPLYAKVIEANDSL